MPKTNSIFHTQQKQLFVLEKQNILKGFQKIDFTDMQNVYNVQVKVASTPAQARTGKNIGMTKFK